MAELSVIVISPDGFCSVDKLLGCLSKQSVRGVLELVCVFPEGADDRPADGLSDPFEALRVVKVPNMESTSVARAASDWSCSSRSTCRTFRVCSASSTRA